MPKRGEAATPAQRAALKRGQKKRAEQLQDHDRDAQRTRWAMLLDGSLSVGDLSDDEIKRGRVKGPGGFVGKAPTLPSHLQQAFQREALRRANERFRKAAPQAVKGLIDIANDPDVKPGDRIRAYQIVLERSLGKVPETIRLEAQDQWGALLDGAFGAVERDLIDEPAREDT